MLDSIDEAIGVHVRKCDVFQANFQQLWFGEEQDSSDVPIKSKHSLVKWNEPVPLSSR